MKVKYKVLLVIMIFLISLSLYVAQSYALWIATAEQGGQNVIDTGCFSINFDDNNGSNVIKLDNTYPVSDAFGLTQDPYKFTITNTCTIDANYIISLNTRTENTLSDDFIKFVFYDTSLDKPQVGTNLGQYKLNTNNLNVDTGEFGISNLNTSYIMDKGLLTAGIKQDDGVTIAPGGSKTYNLYLWIEESATNEIFGQEFQASVEVLATAVNPVTEETY